MNREDSISVLRAGMAGLVDNAPVEPVEENIVRHARLYLDQLERGEWADVELVWHAMGWLDCQLHWWRTMSERERGYVRYYRAVFLDLKTPEPNKLTGLVMPRQFTEVCNDVAKSRDYWGFSPTGTTRKKALEFGERYDTREGVLKSDVTPRGMNGGIRKADTNNSRSA